MRSIHKLYVVLQNPFLNFKSDVTTIILANIYCGLCVLSDTLPGLFNLIRHVKCIIVLLILYIRTQT